MHKVLILLVGALAAGAIVAGCGGDDDDGGDPLTKQEFVTQADQICIDGDAKISKEATKTFAQGQPSTDEQVAFIEDTVAPATQAQIDGIRELTPPEGDEDQVTAILDSADEGIDEIESDPAALTEGGSNPLGEASQLASEYGMKACGQGG